MTVARQLANFLAEIKISDLPERALDLAAMVVASTLASAACGTKIESAQIIRAMAREQGGRADAPVWFDAGEKLPVTSVIQANAVLSDANTFLSLRLFHLLH